MKRLGLFFLLTFLLIGRNLPSGLIIFGLGPWDAVAIFISVNMLVKHNKMIGLSGGIIWPVIFFVFVSIIGIVANLRFGMRWNDILEAVRPFYGLSLVMIGSMIASKLNVTWIRHSLFISSCLVFFTAYLNPMNPDVLGFVQIWNPNVVGNMLIFHAILLLLIADNRINIITTIEVLIILFFAFFTYSKATWLMICLVVPGVFIRQNRYALSISFISVLVIALVYADNVHYLYENVSTLVESKITNSGFGKTASGGSSVGARYGLALSGFLMFLNSPIFGVGLGNFEVVNIMLRPDLGRNFYVDDNANSLVFHYLGTTGLFGCLALLMIIYQFYRKAVKNASTTLAIMTLIYILISVNFQREFFTSNTMWLFLGIFTCINKERNDSFIRPGI